jgi:hypothetical protein
MLTKVKSYTSLASPFLASSGNYNGSDILSPFHQIFISDIKDQTGRKIPASEKNLTVFLQFVDYFYFS